MKKTKLANVWYRVNSSYWFLPTIMTTAAIALAFGAYAMDHALWDRNISAASWLFRGDVDAARTVFSTIATTMITVAGVVFSITIVVLSLTISQFGPLLIRNFMHDKVNQFVLGTFVATFVYCLLVLRSLRSQDGAPVPHISVTIGVLLGIANIGALIYFIHHMAASIQSNNVIASVGTDLRKSIERLYPEEAQKESSGNHDVIPEDFERRALAVPAQKCGDIQAIDTESLLKLASTHDLFLHLSFRPGQFVISGRTLALARPRERVNEEISQDICKAFILGSERTLEQDVEFAANEILEITLRALSPALNDPFMAMTCIDWLGAGLSKLATRRMPSRFHYDQDDKVRMIAQQLDFVIMIDGIFSKLRQHASSSLSVTIRLLEVIAEIAECICRTQDRVSLMRHTILIERGSRHLKLEPWERKAVEESFRIAVRALNGAAAPRASARAGLFESVQHV